MQTIRPNRIFTLLWLAAAAWLIAMPTAQAEDGPQHKVVYQCSEGSLKAYKSLLFSVSQLKNKYQDDIDIVVTCLGPGIHLLAKKPKFEIPEELIAQMEYLSLDGVRFHACGNTMKALGWSGEDMHEFSEIVQIGAEDLMLLQLEGYAYLKW